MVSCPSCAKAAPWRTDNPYRPFCSARCKGIDFGAWAADEYRLPESTLEPPDDFS
ncbi:MAG: DNA gyrase inhibitor YacG [Sterolibacterium sp.]|nr:DNA gyrase inhibitor YacG [Sterolibacterium sp.]